MPRQCIMFVTILLFAAPAFADPVDDIVAAEMRQQHIAGASVAVVRDGAVMKAGGYGMANLEHAVRATADTVYQSGSIGKQFTAGLVMLLVQDRRLQLDAPVSKYLDDVPDAWKQITIRHLLTHTAGLAEDDPAIDLRKDYTETALLRSAYRMPMIAAPGEKWSYSNSGYQILGFICSRVGGKFYGDQLRERIFTPLGMGTRIISERQIVPHRAAGYDLVNGEWLNQEWVSPSINTTADGSLYLTVHDLARWSIALEKDSPLSAAIKTASWTPARLNGGALTTYGFGWEIGTRNARRYVHHTGSWQGFKSYIIRLLDDRLAVIVLANSSNAEPLLIGQRIVDFYLPK